GAVVSPINHPHRPRQCPGARPAHRVSIEPLYRRPLHGERSLLMTTHSWPRRFYSRTPRTFGEAPARFRPRLEGLEDRVTPSTCNVTSLADDGSAGTLRWAISQANANPGSDKITFAPALAGDYLIMDSTELPVITGDLQINGLSADPDASIFIVSNGTR